MVAVDKPSLVESWDDVRHNILTFYNYLSTGDGQLRVFAEQLLCVSRIFIVARIGTQYCFIPAKFAGYKNNTHKLYQQHRNSYGMAAKFQLNKILNSSPITTRVCEGLLMQTYSSLRFNKAAKTFWKLPAALNAKLTSSERRS